MYFSMPGKLGENGLFSQGLGIWGNFVIMVNR